MDDCCRSDARCTFTDVDPFSTDPILHLVSPKPHREERNVELEGGNEAGRPGVINIEVQSPSDIFKDLPDNSRSPQSPCDLNISTQHRIHQTPLLTHTKPESKKYVETEKMQVELLYV